VRVPGAGFQQSSWQIVTVDVSKDAQAHHSLSEY